MFASKRIWDRWYDLFTFGWLDRLEAENPSLAHPIKGALCSIGLGLGAWYLLDPRFVIYSENRSVPDWWTYRLVYGGPFAIATLIAIGYMIQSIRDGLRLPRAVPPPEQGTG
jgi:hypothetical protein